MNPHTACLAGDVEKHRLVADAGDTAEGIRLRDAAMVDMGSRTRSESG